MRKLSYPIEVARPESAWMRRRAGTSQISGRHPGTPTSEKVQLYALYSRSCHGESTSAKRGGRDTGAPRLCPGIMSLSSSVFRLLIFQWCCRDKCSSPNACLLVKKKLRSRIWQSLLSRPAPHSTPSRWSRLALRLSSMASSLTCHGRRGGSFGFALIRTMVAS